MDSKRKLRPVARLLEALEAEQIQFMLIGMSAAIVQGVMETTLDVDIWINLPPRQYMRVQQVARRVGGVVAANTVVYLEDGTPVNFIFAVDGLKSFESEVENTERLKFHGKRIRVLKLERILKSKETVARDKDLAHIIHIRNLLRCRRTTARNRKKKAASRKRGSS
jgi:predicted nucleotidyltransferase